jgi:hypothetical protein
VCLTHLLYIENFLTSFSIIFRYTHYWGNDDLSPEDEQVWKDFWPQLVSDAAIIIDRAGVPIQRDSEDTRPPLLSVQEGIYLNGVGRDGHETLVLNPSGSWDFCKTARKPYDVVVATILLRASILMGKAFHLSSDGAWGEDGWPAAEELFGRIWPDVEIGPESLGEDESEEDE